MEEWRDIPGCEGYEVSDQGRIRHIKQFGYKILRGNPSISNNGKIKNLSVSIAGKRYLVHRLVLTAFRGPCPKGWMGCHEDDDATNNKLSNLRWDIGEGNAADMRRNRGVKLSWRPHRFAGRQLASAYLCGLAGLI